LGYDCLRTEARVLALVSAGEPVSETHEGQNVQVVLDATTFYAESGGQAGDAGAIYTPHGRIEITATRRPVAGLTVHIGRVASGKITLGDAVSVEVDEARRLDIARNHTATHLLHRALREVLGDHARQAGSLVAPDRLRFDFTHLSAMTAEQVARVQEIVNAQIRANLPVSVRQTSYKEALDSGAVALFGEKYGDVVRQVTAGDFSSELCGGTHLAATGQIGFFWLLSEGSVGAGLRRIEAVTGRGAEEFVRGQAARLAELAAALQSKPEELTQRARELLEQGREAQRQIESLRRELIQRDADKLISSAQMVNGVRVLSARVEAADMNALREMADLFRDRLGSALVVLGAVINEKPTLIASATDDLVKSGVSAVKLIQQLAPIVGGGGGGRPNMAQAGGKDPAKLDEALQQVYRLVK
jgi:alanyl-tRNA synthetase